MRIGLAGAGRIGTLHATTLDRLPQVEQVMVADTDPARAHNLARGLHKVTATETVDGLFESDLDGLVVTAATDAHAGLVTRASAEGLPVFCEKPIAMDVPGTLQVLDEIRRSGVPVQVGFQRRFDAGHLAARAAVGCGRLGWVHTLRSCTLDPAPPPREYIPHSGGLFRDCVIHDVDAIRFVTGQDVAAVIAAGANKGDPCFREFDDVDTAAAVLVLEDGTLALVSATRYNAAGYDVRLEVLGSRDSVVAGLDERTPLTPLTPPTPSDPPGQTGPTGGLGGPTGATGATPVSTVAGTATRMTARPAASTGCRADGGRATATVDAPARTASGPSAAGRAPAYGGFLERFAGAYAAELETFTEVVSGRIGSPCPPEEALEAFYVAEACELSRREGRAVTIKEVRS